MLQTPRERRHPSSCDFPARSSQACLNQNGYGCWGPFDRALVASCRLWVLSCPSTSWSPIEILAATHPSKGPGPLLLTGPPSSVSLTLHSSTIFAPPPPPPRSLSSPLFWLHCSAQPRIQFRRAKRRRQQHSSHELTDARR